ncbi:MAG: hypothetical protein H6579_09735 [Chitinophagales bacterium]|nr:hypothetical protein [Chitinophagales bacterium]
MKYLFLFALVFSIGAQQLSSSKLLSKIDIEFQLDAENDTEDNDTNEYDKILDLLNGIGETKGLDKQSFHILTFIYFQSVLQHILVPPPDFI